MGKVNSQEIYKEYLVWFEELAKTPQGRQELRERKAFPEYANYKVEPTPYTFGLWLINDKNSGVDEVKLRDRMHFNKAKNSKIIGEAFKHVGGNINAPLLDPKYIENAREWHAENNRRKAADPEWQANDNFTKEVHRISESGPNIYSEWEKINKVKPTPNILNYIDENLQTTYVAPVAPSKPGLIQKVASFISNLGGTTRNTPTEPTSYMEKQEMFKNLEKK